MIPTWKIKNMREQYFRYIIVGNLSTVWNVTCIVTLLKVLDNNYVISAHQF